MRGMSKIIAVMVSIIIIMGVTWMIFEFLSTIKDEPAQFLEERAEIFTECGNWLATGAFTKTYPDALNQITSRFRDQSLDPICMPRSEVTSPTDLFDCRVMCVLLTKANDKCADDPEFYDGVSVNSQFFSGDSAIANDVSGAYIGKVKVSHCKGRIAQIIMNLDHDQLSLLHDCWVNPSALSESSAARCTPWKEGRGA